MNPGISLFRVAYNTLSLSQPPTPNPTPPPPNFAPALFTISGVTVVLLFVFHIRIAHDTPWLPPPLV